MKKHTLWLLISDLNRPDIALVLPSLAWMARDAGAEFECYLESERNGRLFARTGSTVLGGFHHQQFNYLCAAFEVKFLMLGQTELFDSSLPLFGGEVLARSDSTPDFYASATKNSGLAAPQTALFGPVKTLRTGESELEIAPYLFSEIFHRRALGFGASESAEAAKMVGDAPSYALFLDESERASVQANFSNLEDIDAVQDGDTYATITRRIAARWKHSSQGVAFGDPAAILSQIPAHCRAGRLAIFGARQSVAPAQIVNSAYTEQMSEAVHDASQLALELGNPVLVGRQTGDGDIFEWSRSGVCIQIIDPNRPAFPVVETVPHVWSASGDIWGDEPDDDTLLRYAKENKVLSTLLWHSGEVAHNEAMLNLFEVCTFTGVKMGIGAHAQRYQTCPQLWEMLAVARAKGGVRGLIEPVLHSGGLGVLAEVNCPHEMLQKHCENALRQIRELAGEAGVPRGYYAFLDSDLETLTAQHPAIFEAVSRAGLDYFVSSARPGRNRMLWKNEKSVALNQSCRVVRGASPFVRITTSDDISTAASVRPGWMIATLDAPVISFNPYVWRHGTRFMELVERVKSGYINVLPHTIARYARILQREGFLPTVQ